MVWEVEVRKVSCQATQAMCGGPPTVLLDFNKQEHSEVAAARYALFQSGAAHPRRSLPSCVSCPSRPDQALTEGRGQCWSEPRKD